MEKVQRLTGFVESTELELRTTLGLVEDASRSWEEIFTTKEDRDRITTENEVVHAPRTKILELKTTTGSLAGSLQEVKACAFETVRELKKSLKTIAVSDSQQKTLIDKFMSLTEELSSIHAECANLMVDLDELTALVQLMEDDVRTSLSHVSTEVQKNCKDVFEAVKLNLQAGLVDWWK